MENQHRKISGYRELSQAEIDLMNEVKAFGPQLAQLLDKIDAHVQQQTLAALNNPDKAESDMEQERLDAANPRRWNAIARTHLQEGLMAATRAVAQPTFF